MARRVQVDPEVLRKARRLVEVYDLKPRISNVSIETRVFPMRYDRDGWMYLNHEYFDLIQRQLAIFQNAHYDIQGVEFTFETVPNTNVIHSVLFDDDKWRTIAVTPKINASFAISLTGPIQDNRHHRQVKKPTVIRTIQTIATDQGQYIIPSFKTYDFEWVRSDSDDLYISLPILGHFMIEQKFKGIIYCP